MKIVITGSEGMLGKAVSHVLCHEHDSIPYSHHELDVTRKDSFHKLCERGIPDVIIHCAAFTNVNSAELDENYNTLWQTNVTSVVWLCELCKKYNIKLIYPQTFLILKEQEEPYRPLENFSEINSDLVLGKYARSKYEAEKIILRELHPNQRMIIRLGGFFGKGEHGDKRFVGLFLNKLLLELIRQGNRRIEIGDRVWQPTWTIDIANVIKYVLSIKWKSFYQYAGLDTVSFADLAEMLLNIIGMKMIEINKVPSNNVEGSGSAPRPGKVILDSSKELIEAGLVYPLFPRLNNYILTEWSSQIKLLKKEFGIENVDR